MPVPKPTSELDLAKHNLRIARTSVRLAHQRFTEANEMLDIHLEHLERKQQAVAAFGIDPETVL